AATMMLVTTSPIAWLQGTTRCLSTPCTGGTRRIDTSAVDIPTLGSTDTQTRFGSPLRATKERTSRAAPRTCSCSRLADRDAGTRFGPLWRSRVRANARWQRPAGYRREQRRLGERDALYRLPNLCRRP